MRQVARLIAWCTGFVCVAVGVWPAAILILGATYDVVHEVIS